MTRAAPVSLREFACKLGGEVHGDHVLAPGPGHSGGDRSLSVTLSATAPDGFVVNSFAGDDPITCKDHIRKRLGLDAFKPNGGGKGNGGGTKTKSREIIYDYRDPRTGAVRHRKTRVEFSDGSKNFFFSIKGRTPLLYGDERLADLSEGQAVWVVEGEKCVHRMRELGAIAVSGDTCSSSKWLPAHAELLRGLDVIFWPDSDDPGETYIANAAAALEGTRPG